MRTVRILLAAMIGVVLLGFVVAVWSGGGVATPTARTTTTGTTTTTVLHG